MSRDHLRLTGNSQERKPRIRLVHSQEGPRDVSVLENFTFSVVDGELVVLHNEQRCTAAEAMVTITGLVARHMKPAPGALFVDLNTVGAIDHLLAQGFDDPPKSGA
jgi:hypothetical protein